MVTSEPTGSGTFLSFVAFPPPKWKIPEGDFSWVEPLKPIIWNLFDIGPLMKGEVRQLLEFLQVTDTRLIPF